MLLLTYVSSKTRALICKFAIRSCGTFIHDPYSQLIEFHGKWPLQEQQNFVKDLRILPDFISEQEEESLIEEIEPYMNRLHYENDHWDDAIHGYRETERKKWYPHNRVVLDRVRQAAFDDAVMPYVHILDLTADGVIKPHVDSVRYCGNTIAGLSLLSDAVMRLVRTDEQKYNQEAQNNANVTATSNDNAGYRNQPVAVLENNFYADIWLRRRSLYIMSHTSRYNFTHEVLANEQGTFQGRHIQKTRRISIICRNEPAGV